MNSKQRATRDALIERLYAQGVRQFDIARRVKLNPPRVHDVLVARGLLRSPMAIPHQTTTIWDQDSIDRRKQAIWKRQREGAKQALQAMNVQQ